MRTKTYNYYIQQTISAGFLYSGILRARHTSQLSCIEEICVAVRFYAVGRRLVGYKIRAVLNLR